MPIYEYECDRCGERFEDLMGKSGDSLEQNCVYDCGGVAHRVMCATSSLTGKAGRSGCEDFFSGLEVPLKVEVEYGGSCKYGHWFNFSVGPDRDKMN